MFGYSLTMIRGPIPSSGAGLGFFLTIEAATHAVGHIFSNFEPIEPSQIVVYRPGGDGPDRETRFVEITDPSNPDVARAIFKVFPAEYVPVTEDVEGNPPA